MRIPTNFIPRDYQLPVWEALVTKKTHKRAALVWPRRAGKDLTAINIAAWHAIMERVGNYYYFLPSYTQGEKVVWDGKRGDGESFLSVFPEEMIDSVDNRKMKLKLTNGSLFQVVGASEQDSVVGTNPVFCVFSEYSICSPKFWDYIRPILVENGGIAIFTYTARGLNHGWRLYETTKNNPNWFTEFRTCENVLHNGKRIITDDIIDEERRSGMSEELIRQEFYNDFYASNTGAYYAKEMRDLHDAGRITDVPHDPSKEVHTAWDLGMRDATAIWFFQLDFAGNVNVIDTYACTGQGIEEYIRVLKRKSYIYGTHFAPHDIRVSELGTGKTRLEAALQLGVRFEVLPKLSVQDGIDAARSVLPRCRFDQTKCFDGLEALRQYCKEESGMVDMHGMPIYRNQPKHDWCVTEDTEVLTDYGMCRIIDLPYEGKVLTECGWKRYIAPRKTRIAAPLVEVTFSDGSTVRCTPDHPFLTDSGWILSENLTPGTLIQSSLTPTLSILLKACTSVGLTRLITLVEGKNYTETFGRTLLGKSLKGITSTIRTVIQKITHSVTWSAYLRKNTGKNLRNIIPAFLTKPERQQQSGINPQRVALGTDSRQSAQEGGQSGSVCQKIALSAEKLSMLSKENLATLRNTVTQTARPLRIDGVRHLSYTEDVWCITVPGVEQFSLANGAITHNTSHYADGFRYASIAINRIAPSTLSKRQQELGEEGSLLELPSRAIYDEGKLFS